MKALLYKDFCVLWKQMKYMLFLVALFCLIPQPGPEPEPVLCHLRRGDDPHEPHGL